jgi:predicted small secreted protein
VNPAAFLILINREMKKLVLMFVAVAAISFASCGNKTNANEAGQDTTDSILPVVGDDNLIDLEDSLNNDSNLVK